tara:strand:+ start:346 stop:900 length:555 start_codon:yes stop_codon:yes gene_type:complete
MERSYNIPLRKEWLKVPRYKRAKKAVKALREFLIKHMKSDDLNIGKNLNEAIWNRGIRNPPHHVKVNVLKDEDNKVYVELEGFEIQKKEVKEEPKQETVKDKLKALKEKTVGKEAPKVKEVGKEAEKPKTEVKEIPKAEVKEAVKPKVEEVPKVEKSEPEVKETTKEEAVKETSKAKPETKKED